jgi:hypothetical protein
MPILPPFIPSMILYITECLHDGFRHEGPRIAAGSWAEALAVAEGLGVILVGELQFVTDGDGAVIDARGQINEDVN